MVQTDFYIGGRCSCASVELTWVRIGLVMRCVDKVRVRANYTIGFRR